MSMVTSLAKKPNNDNTLIIAGIKTDFNIGLCLASAFFYELNNAKILKNPTKSNISRCVG